MEIFKKPIAYILNISDLTTQKNTATVFKKSLTIDGRWNEAIPPDFPAIMGPDDLCAQFSVSKIKLAQNQVFLTKKKAIQLLQESEYKDAVTDNDLRSLTKNSYRAIFDREATRGENRELIFTYAEILHFFRFRKIYNFPTELEHLL